MYWNWNYYHLVYLVSQQKKTNKWTTKAYSIHYYSLCCFTYKWTDPINRFDLIPDDCKGSWISGSSKTVIRRRRALVNCMCELAPSRTMTANVNGLIRKCLYAVAPVYLWQYFSGQGRTHCEKYNLLDHVPNTCMYRAILTTSAHVTRESQEEIISSLSNVIKSCKNRAESKTFRSRHPELGLVDDSIIDHPDIDLLCNADAETDSDKNVSTSDDSDSCD